MSMLMVKNLFFNYGTVPILEGISFDVRKGQLYGLFGPNGCGKTTLFKCCLKFLKTSSGDVLIDGIDINKIKTSRMAKLVAYIPQEHKPPFPFLVKEIVLMGRTPHMGGIFGIQKEDKEKAMEALDLLGISSLADRSYNRLSGGQRQMVLIARAIAQETDLILLDEPTSFLDFSNQIRIWKLLRTIADRGVTLLACSHDPNHVSWFCDHVIAISSKRVLAQGTASEVLCPENLNNIYGEICAIQKVGQHQMILPKEMLDE